MFLFLFLLRIWKNIHFISTIYINECIDINKALKNSFKSMSCSGRINQFPKISYAGKPQVVSRYILSNLCPWPFKFSLRKYKTVFKKRLISFQHFFERNSTLSNFLEYFFSSSACVLSKLATLTNSVALLPKLRYNVELWRNDTDYNDIQHNDTQHYDSKHNDIQHNDTKHNDTKHQDTQHFDS